MPDPVTTKNTRKPARRRNVAHAQPLRHDAEDQRFALAYLDHQLNGTQAAREIWPDLSYAGAGSKACRMLAKKSVQEIIAGIRKREGEQFFDLRARTLRRYEQIAFADIRELFTEQGAFRGAHELDESIAPLLASVKSREETVEGVKIADIVEVKTRDQLHALDSISKTLGTFVDKHEHTGPGGEPIVVEVVRFTEPYKPGEKP